MSNLEPAATIVARLGGPAVVAGVVSVHRTRVSNWKRPKEKGGTGGLIPQKYHRPLLDYAARNEIDLKAEDFLASADDSVVAS
ncbi:hypothetical protein [Bradyrhizobium yuanmingense]|uniref:hypothetical protein n=1 Tax=Bradyrhizobium yuanmingense TaxID=108015 RepID=UPI0004B7BBDC|nr:hypothetical protein [Bradyrhizobium yuanmingense]